MLAGKVVNQTIMSFKLDNNLMTNEIIPFTITFGKIRQ